MRGQPSYRVVVADSRSPRDGRFLENIGHYNPRTEPPTVHIDGERARHWLSVGARPSDAVARLLEKEGVIEDRTLEYRTKAKSGEPDAEEPAPAEESEE
jgi:small subunit ribosomal protein S16